MNDIPEVIMYVDGSCIPNPGNGGVGVVLLFGAHRKELSINVGHVSNNAAEILAAVEGLKALKQPCRVTITSDSQYLISTMNGAFSRGANLALWALLDSFADKHQVTWEWTRSHVGDPNNEKAHMLAEQAARRTDVPLFE